MPKKKKKARVYQSRVVGGQVMLQADLERLHKYMLSPSYCGLEMS